MRTILDWARATAWIVALATTATAQTTTKPLPAPLAGTDLPSRPLLEEPVIQREIGLTNKQRENLALVEADANEARQEGQANLGEEGFDFNAMMGGMEETAKQQRSAIAKLLTPAQRTRLLQIEWQREGWIALGRSDVIARLKLKPAQAQQIRSIIEAMRRGQSDAVFAPPDEVVASRKNGKAKPNLNPSNGFMGDPNETIPGGGPMNFSPDGLQAQASKNIEAATKVQAAAAIEVDKILTADQHEAFLRLLGPSFDFKSLTTTEGTAPPAAAPKRSTAPGKRSTKAR